MTRNATTRAWSGRAFIGVSLDGYIARPDGDLDWLTDPPAGRDHAEVAGGPRAQTWETFYPDIDHLVMGRGTYDKVLSFGFWPFEGKNVVVLSSTLADTDDGITVVRDLDQALSLLDAHNARQVYVDGGRVIQEFLRADLLDEITVSWAPVLIGGGRPLFGSLDAERLLTLTGCHTSDGMVHATYRIHRDPHLASHGRSDPGS